MKNKLFPNIILFSISLLFCFAVLELFFRIYPYTNENIIADSWFNKERWLVAQTKEKGITYEVIDTFDKNLGWKLIPNIKTRIKLIDSIYYSIQSNSRGERGLKEIPIKRNKKKRILFLGDSYTFGECVNEGEYFSFYIDRLLDSVEVINMGIHGYGHDQMIQHYLLNGKRYNPDIVVLGAYNEDLIRNTLWFRDYYKPFYSLTTNNEIELNNNHIIEPEVLKRKLRSSLIHFLLHKITSFSIEGKANFYKKTSFAVLNELHKQVCDNGTKLILLHLPSPEDLKKGMHIDDTFLTFCKNKNIPLIDTKPSILYFLERDTSRKNHFFNHYSKEIHFEIAKAFVRECEHYNYLK